MMLKALQRKITALYNRLYYERLLGKDPYQYQELIHRFKISKIPINRIMQHNILGLANTFINDLRFLADPLITKKFYPEVAGLVLQSLSRLEYANFKLKNTYTFVKYLIKMLEKSKNSTYPGASWGLPFTWYTYITIPAYVPASTTTSFVGYGLLDAFLFIAHLILLDYI